MQGRRRRAGCGPSPCGCAASGPRTGNFLSSEVAKIASPGRARDRANARATTPPGSRAIRARTPIPGALLSQITLGTEASDHPPDDRGDAASSRCTPGAADPAVAWRMQESRLGRHGRKRVDARVEADAATGRSAAWILGTTCSSRRPAAISSRPTTSPSTACSTAGSRPAWSRTRTATTRTWTSTSPTCCTRSSTPSTPSSRRSSCRATTWTCSGASPTRPTRASATSSTRPTPTSCWSRPASSTTRLLP